MADQFDVAFNSLRAAFQAVTGATPTVTIGAVTAQIIPGNQGIDSMFSDGGTYNNATVPVMCRASDFATLPTKFSVATLAGHSSAANGTYQVLNVTQREGTITLDLGNIDGEGA